MQMCKYILWIKKCGNTKRRAPDVYRDNSIMKVIGLWSKTNIPSLISSNAPLTTVQDIPG